MIESMFSIKHNKAAKPANKESIDLHGAVIHLPTTTFRFVPIFALILMATSIISATFLLFFSGLILITEYVSPNSKCPSEGPTHCYTTVNNTYFYCNSSDVRINASLGSLVCYRWIKENLDTKDVLSQIGLYGGLIQALEWFVKIFLRMLFQGLQRKKQSACSRETTGMQIVVFMQRRQLLKICFTLLIVILLALGPCIALIILGMKNISRTGITMTVLSTIFLISVSGILLFVTYESAKFKHGNIAFNKFDTIAVLPSAIASESVTPHDTSKETKISITRIVPVIH